MEKKRLQDILSEVLGETRPGAREPLGEVQLAKILARLLFTSAGPDDSLASKMIEVRDYEDISQKGPFKYAGQVATLFREGLMPTDVYEALMNMGIDRHIGPSYLRVKGLLTDRVARRFFGGQMANLICDYLRNTPPSRSDGYVVCIPNMTGGVWIGDETARQLERVLTDYEVWPATPYARETRKPVDVVPFGDSLVNYVEGWMPPPRRTAVIFCFEELRTTAETTQNATKVYRAFGYGDENDVRIVEACVFDYLHPAGLMRLQRLGVDSLYLVSGRVFFEVSRELGYISDLQFRTVTDWLAEPWEFTKRIIPMIKQSMVE